MAEPEKVSVDFELIKKLGPAAEQLGIHLPGLVQFAPTIDLTQSVSRLALDIGRLVAKQNIFRKNGDVVTVDAKTGEMRRMTPVRFCGWIETFCQTRAPGSKRVRESMSREDADVIMAQDVFMDSLRPLEAVNLMRLPVIRKDGKIEFLEHGYDAESGIFTAEAVTYDMDWTLERGFDFLNEHGEEWPWNWPGEKGDEMWRNRSFCVHVAAMVGTYCRAMFPPWTPRPMITYISNQAGTGKSTLVEMVLRPVHGEVATTDAPKDDGEMNKALQAAALNSAPYLFLDDIGGGLFSNQLNRFITSSAHAGRVMGGNKEWFQVAAVTQVYATGNDIKLTPDLMRRSLVAELFLSGEVQGRKFKRTITAAYLSQPDVRAGFLAALCAIVRNYAELKEMLPIDKQRHPMPLASFTEWTGLVSAIVQLAGYNDPLLPPDLSSGGAEEEDEMKELLVKVATAAVGDTVFDRKGLVEAARRFGLLESLVGTPDEKDLDSKSNKRFGRQLQRWRGRELRDEDGRRFRFGYKRQKHGATYPLTFI